MKTLIIVTLAFFSVAISLCAQGQVNFANTQSTPVWAGDPNGTAAVIGSPPDSYYYFGLFLGQPNRNWYFTGLYATNLPVIGANGFGLFSGGTVNVPGWPVGVSTNYFVAGWSGPSSAVGTNAAYSGPHDFQAQWLTGKGLPMYFGVSGVGSGIAGDGMKIPALNLFEGGTGTLQPLPGPTGAGFFLYPSSLVPEPSCSKLAVVGLATILLYRTLLKRNQAIVFDFGR